MESVTEKVGPRHPFRGWGRVGRLGFLAGTCCSDRDRPRDRAHRGWPVRDRPVRHRPAAPRADARGRAPRDRRRRSQRSVEHELRRRRLRRSGSRRRYRLRLPERLEPRAVVRGERLRALMVSARSPTAPGHSTKRYAAPPSRPRCRGGGHLHHPRRARRRWTWAAISGRRASQGRGDRATGGGWSLHGAELAPRGRRDLEEVPRSPSRRTCAGWPGRPRTSSSWSRWGFARGDRPVLLARSQPAAPPCSAPGRATTTEDDVHFAQTLASRMSRSTTRAFSPTSRAAADGHGDVDPRRGSGRPRPRRRACLRQPRSGTDDGVQLRGAHLPPRGGGDRYLVRD